MLQVVVSWTAEDGCSVHRVVTQQLQPTTSRAAALKGTDSKMAALLLAKRIIQEAFKTGAAGSKHASEKLRQAIGELL